MSDVLHKLVDGQLVPCTQADLDQIELDRQQPPHLPSHSEPRDADAGPYPQEPSPPEPEPPPEPPPISTKTREALSAKRKPQRR